MKILIDIDENLYTRLFDNGKTNVMDMRRACVAIRKGTPLDKIRAEIANHCGLIKEDHCRYCSYCNSVMGIREILEIIDKYKAESEE